MLALLKAVLLTNATGSIFKDSMGNTGTNYSVDKQIGKKSSVGINKNSIYHTKNLGKGFTLKTEFNKKGVQSIPFGNNQGAGVPFKNQVVMSISKPL